MEGITASYRLHKLLGKAISHRSNKNAPVGQLIEEWLGDFRGCCGDNNPVKRGVFGSAEGAICCQDRNLLIIQGSKGVCR